MSGFELFSNEQSKLNNTYITQLYTQIIQEKCLILVERNVKKCLDSRPFQVFHTDDFELQLLQKGHCPFCRRSADFLSAAGKEPTEEEDD